MKGNTAHAMIYLFIYWNLIFVYNLSCSNYYRLMSCSSRLHLPMTRLECFSVSYSLGMTSSEKRSLMNSKVGVHQNKILALWSKVVLVNYVLKYIFFSFVTLCPDHMVELSKSKYARNIVKKFLMYG